MDLVSLKKKYRKIFCTRVAGYEIYWKMKNGIKEIPIEERGSEEVKYARGFLDGKIREVLLTPKDSPSANYAFDVTPARLVTGLITEKGVCKADEKSLLKLFPEKVVK